MSRRFPTTISILVIAAAGSAPAVGANAADTCDVLYSAGIRAVQTPHHVYSSTTHRGGKPQSGEAVYAGGIEYVLLNGKWQRSPMTPQDMLEAAQARLKAHSDTCTLVGDQMVGGQTVSVYKAHDNERGTEQLVRILKSSGLLQGSTLTLPDGTVVETRYEYTNVRAPALPAGAQ